MTKNEIEKPEAENNQDKFETARVISEHKKRYIVGTDNEIYDAEITGNMRYTANSRDDFPAVGDWVSVAIYDNDFAVIHKVLPRTSVLRRQAVGKFGEMQIIAANIDYAFITQAVDRDFNINRIERYLTICNSANVKPFIILSKTDLIDNNELESLITDFNSRISNIPIISVSSQTHNGIEELKSLLEKDKTYCFLGSSGVGKSTLINILLGKEIIKTSSISGSTGKGKHTTSRRELFILENGSILIDNPGMREVGIADTSDGLEITFDSIIQISKNCKFSDCKHISEKGCAVIDAVGKGIIDESSYKNFLKMEREKIRFQSTVADKRKKDKEFGKMVKEVMKYKKHKY
ncbi:MAG: ribosome small subunit-dependent GTPase A [Ignavibacteria bacterium]|nr:ribosome small subunit-dependent GTPase A [Ignavibacteria bacterium]